MIDNDQHFWSSYVDIMTSLFFVMLVLFIVSYRLYSKKISGLEVKLEEAEKIKEIHSTLEALLQDTSFFIYEEKYKRYRLSQDVEFEPEKFEIKPEQIYNFKTTRNQLIQTGRKLQKVLDTLLYKKNSETTKNKYSSVSYTMIISGRASRDGASSLNYPLSYNRAYNLYKFWQREVIDFDSEKYQEIVDLQISGVGEGGVGRFDDDTKNRCFFIQIIPKIGELRNQQIESVCRKKDF